MQHWQHWIPMLAVSWVLWGTILPEFPTTSGPITPDWRALAPFATESACHQAIPSWQAQYPTLAVNEVSITREYRCLPKGAQPPGRVR